MKKPMMILTAILTIITLFTDPAHAEDKKKLVFGAIAVGKVSKVKKSLTPPDPLSQRKGRC